MPQDSEALSLQQFFGAIRHRWAIVALSVVVVGGAAFVASKREAKQYLATSSLVFKSNPLSQEIAGLPGGGVVTSSNLLAQQANDLELVRGGDTAAATARVLGHGLTAAAVAGSLSFGAQGESGVIEVTATSASPTLAAAMANVYTEQFAKQQQSADREYFKSALALVHKQLAALTPQQRTGQDGLQLQNRLQSLGLLAKLGTSNVQVAERAFPPVSPSSPKTSRNTTLGLLLGLVLGLLAVIVLERLDRRIKRPQELEAIYRLPLLGSIPRSAAIARLARGGEAKQKPLPPNVAETFNLIHAHLRCFNVDRELRTLMVTSPALGDGKSTIARHLAEAAARSGSRVLLLEADLRKPTLAEQIGLGQGPGLAEVLIGDVPLAEAIVPVELEAPGAHNASGARKLDVLAVGALLPPNPAELLGSRAMDAVLDVARSQYDLVVVDAAPLTAVSDPFPLLRKVDGVVVVGWVAHSRRDAAEELYRVLAGSGAPLLGVIANGWKSGVPNAYARQSAEIPLAASRNGAAPADASELVSTAKL